MRWTSSAEIAVTSRQPRARRWSAVLRLAAGLFLAASPSLARGQAGSASKQGTEAIERKVKQVLESPGFANAHWGLLVVDRGTGETVYERNSRQLFAPASVTKLFSTAAALVELGQDYRFETPVLRRGELDARGALHGDLILVAQGDPSMGGRTGADGKLVFKDDDHIYAGENSRSELVSTDPLAGLEHLAREVRAAGIKHVMGDVLVDDRLFEAAESTGSGPSRISPIMINDNVVDVLVQPGKAAGEPAQVSFQPATRSLIMDALVETAAAETKPKLKVKSAGPRGFTVRGTIPAGHRPLVLIHEIENPATFARALFIEALRNHDVRVDASPLGANAAGGLPPRSSMASLPKVAVYTSPPFREFVKVILKVSHNLHASTLPLLLAARHGEATLSAGLRRQGDVLKTLGVDPTSVSFGGGAGGARADLVTPRAAVALLLAMASRPDFAAFEAALPVLGRDGTLTRAVKPDSPARGHVHAKTGTYWVENELTGKTILTSKALAGYLETASGRSLVLAAFLNNVALDAPSADKTVSEAAAEAGRLLGRLCEILYDDGGNAASNRQTQQPSGAPAPTIRPQGSQTE